MASHESFQPWLASPPVWLAGGSRHSRRRRHRSARSSRARRRRAQPGDDLVGETPAPQLPEQHHEQRSGVDGAVVDPALVEGEACGRPEPHLMEDLARLLLGARVHLGSGQLSSGPAGQVGPGDIHPPGEQRIAAEHGHEPRRTGGHDRQLGMVGIEDAQGSQVLDRPSHRPGQDRRVGLDRRHGAQPRRVPLGRHRNGVVATAEPPAGRSPNRTPTSMPNSRSSRGASRTARSPARLDGGVAGDRDHSLRAVGVDQCEHARPVSHRHAGGRTASSLTSNRPAKSVSQSSSTTTSQGSSP